VTPLVVLLIVIAALTLFVGFSYNQLVRLRNKVDEAWQDVDVQLQRRHDLVPKLVEITKGYAAHERAIFDEVARARSEAQAVAGVADRSAPEAKLASVLTSAVAVVEAYPELRAAESFLELQHEIAHTEDEVAAARYIYNGNVRVFNTRIQTLPVSLYAEAFGFGPAEFFQADLAEKVPSDVKVGG